MSRRLLERYANADSDLVRDRSVGARFILMLFCELADDDSLEARPGVAKLMLLTGYGERQVQRFIKELVDHGLLEVIENHGGRHRHASYRVAIGVRAASLFDAPN